MPLTCASEGLPPSRREVKRVGANAIDGQTGLSCYNHFALATVFIKCHQEWLAVVTGAQVSQNIDD